MYCDPLTQLHIVIDDTYMLHYIKTPKKYNLHYLGELF